VHDRTTFERLFADHARDVLAYALRRTDAATVEDVVAEVFAVAWRRWERTAACRRRRSAGRRSDRARWVPSAGAEGRPPRVLVRSTARC
jgi:hypothetical protein